LCDDKTRYIGDMVAVVVAENEHAAQLGARKVKLTWEPLDLLTDPEQAVSGEGPQIHSTGNILHQIHYAAGDLEVAFTRPDVVVVENIYRTQFMDHAFLETESGIAFPEKGGVRVISGGQNPYYDQQQVAQCLSLPIEKVRMIEPYSGGAFGGKGDITVQIVVALAALLTGKPCRMTWTREEHFLAGVKRHPVNIWIKCAATRSGELVALQTRIIADTGAYAVFGDAILELMAENITGPYRVSNVLVDAWSVYTNNAVCGAFRGFGATQACLAIEGQMSQLADKLGIDEIEFRMQNFLAQGQRSGMGHEILLPLGVEVALKTAAAHPLWRSRNKIMQSSNPIRRGIGMAISMKGFSLGVNDAQDFSAANLALTSDGRFILQTGIVELGQGSFTALVQIASEVLNCSPSLFEFHSADTQENPNAGTTAASRVTYSVGRAVVNAAHELSDKIRQLAALSFEVPLENVEITNNIVKDCLSGKLLSLTDIARLSAEPLQVHHQQRIPYSEKMTTGGLGHPHVLYSSNTQLVQLVVDTETGEIRVEQVVCFPEAGQVINKLGLEGQCEGGILQGIGYALMEQVVIEKGRVLNSDLTRYPIPTVADTPLMEVIPVEVLESTGPFGAKGAAENATIPTAPAILDAIEKAIGVRFTSLPVTPERVIQALATQSPAQPS
jgi:CO/xanthine dehydrogenase Mo-binding subunit